MKRGVRKDPAYRRTVKLQAGSFRSAKATADHRSFSGGGLDPAFP